MNKDILMDYIDSCRLIEETEEDMMRLNRETYSHEDAHRKYEEILLKRIKNAEEKKLRVEEWMLALPSRIQRIIRLHYFEKMSWKNTAAKLGPYDTAESVRQEFWRYVKK